jgi:hypothetical protein
LSSKFQKNPSRSTSLDPALGQPAFPGEVIAGNDAGCIRFIQQHLSQILNYSELKEKFEKAFRTHETEISSSTFQITESPGTALHRSDAV